MPRHPSGNPAALDHAALYTCDRCGRQFSIGYRLTSPSGRGIARILGDDGLPVPVRPFVRLGGRPVCVVCASGRYPRRRYGPSALLDPAAVR